MQKLCGSFVLAANFEFRSQADLQTITAMSKDVRILLGGRYILSKVWYNMEIPELEIFNLKNVLMDYIIPCIDG